MEKTVEERVKQLIATELAVDIAEVTSNADLEIDLGADSLDRTELICMIEDEFECTIPDELDDTVKSVADLVKLAENAKRKK